MNSVIEAQLRIGVNYEMNNWVALLPYVQIAIKARDATLTKVSPFFMQHGYNVDPLQLIVSEGPERKKYNKKKRSDREKAESIVKRLD